LAVSTLPSSRSFFWLAANDLQLGAILLRWGGLNERIARRSIAAM
jgi:hypothetical protein